MLRGILRKHTPSPALAVASLALILAMAGVGVAAIPDSGGTIHACYVKNPPMLGLGAPQGAVRVIDSDKGQGCSGGETALSFSQTGPAGPAGPEGPAGINGYQIISKNVDLAPLQFNDFQVFCPSTKRVLSASVLPGFVADAAQYPTVLDSPVPEGVGWQGTIFNNDSSPQYATVNVICAHVG